MRNWVSKLVDILIYIVRGLGLLFLVLGCFFEFIGALGVIKAKEFFVRAHMTTVSTVGGTVVPLIGVALISLTFVELEIGRIYLASLCIISAIFLIITTPTGSHALMRAAYISKTGEKFEEE